MSIKIVKFAINIFLFLAHCHETSYGVVVDGMAKSSGSKPSFVAKWHCPKGLITLLSASVAS